MGRKVCFEVCYGVLIGEDGKYVIEVGVLVFEGVEPLDAIGPLEVFSVASRMQSGDTPSEEQLSVHLIAEENTAVEARYGVRLHPHFGFGEHPRLQVAIVPGGVVDDARHCLGVRSWICRAADSCEILASVCNGAFLLAEAGLLDGRQASTHWQDATELRASFPAVDVVNEVWCDEGETVTSAGISAGIDMSLHLVARLSGMDLARRTARQMVYDWRESRQ